MMKTEQQLHALHGKDYVDRFEKNQSQFRLNRLIPFFNLDNSQHAVDFACGNGMLMPYIAGKVKSYTGVDFSKDFIAAAERHKQQQQISNASLYCDDIIHFSLTRENSFELGFAMDFSEHVYDDSWVEILQAIRFTLKKNAKFYIHTPNLDYFVEFLKDQGFFKQLPEHIAVRNIADNCRLMKRAGFSNIQVHELAHYENRQKWIHPLRHLPLVGKYCSARLLIEASV